MMMEIEMRDHGKFLDGEKEQRYVVQYKQNTIVMSSK